MKDKTILSEYFIIIYLKIYKSIFLLFFIILVLYTIITNGKLIKSKTNNKKVIKKIKIFNPNNTKQIKNFINEKKYIDNCLKLLLINPNLNIKKINILISIIIPIYNSNKTIIQSVRSIQNQNFSQFEILLVNDFSKDNSLSLIRNLQKQDQRIKIINNKNNMGTLYSRSIGALKAKGEYIFSLDNDDMYFNKDVLDVTYKNAKNGNFDIIKFNKYYILYNNFNLNNIKDIIINEKDNNKTLQQPELGIYPISRNGYFYHNDYVIWDKCIKSNIYKDAVNKLGKDIYKKISWNEDIIISYIIFNIAKTFKAINKFGIIHIIYNNSASFTRKPNEKIFCDIFFLDIIYKFSNLENKNFAVEYLIKNKRFNYIYMNNKNRNYLKSIIKKMISSKYISKKNKFILKNKLNQKLF